MTAQEWIVLAVGVLAVAYLGWRAVCRRLTANCCGKRECPAAETVVRRMGDADRSTRPGA